jgi:phenylacetic acid degradation operon negative regulatory protein
MGSSPLDSALARLGPPRIASFIVTLWGDAVAPRGGSLWLGTLQAVLDRFGCTPGQVRTAMSRLTEEGWLARNRVGRLSYYRLGPRGEAVFAGAATRIYAGAPPRWDGRFVLVRPESPAALQALDAALFGHVAPELRIGLSAPPALEAAILLEATPRSLAEARRLALQSWQLDGLAAQYQRFLEGFGDLPAVPPAEAMPLRLLLVHEWRRVVLRDPALPAELLPEDWPGHAARALAIRLYRQLLGASEAWLDAYGRCEAGALPGARLEDRFREG